MSFDFDASSRTMSSDAFSAAYNFPLTMIAWWKCTGGQWGEVAQDFAVWFSDDLTTQNNSFKMVKTFGAADRVSASSRTGTDSLAHHTFGSSLFDDIWVPVITVFIADNDRRVYIEDSSRTTGSSGTRAISPDADLIRIGGNAGGFSNFAGLLAEIAIFNIVFSATQVDKARVAVGAGIRPNLIAPSDCIAYWDLKDDLSTIPDQSGNGGPDLTVTNAVHSTDHPIIVESASGFNPHFAHRNNTLLRM